MTPTAFPAQLGDFDLHLFGEGHTGMPTAFWAPICARWTG